jgi:hypothetical protein
MRCSAWATSLIETLFDEDLGAEDGPGDVRPADVAVTVIVPAPVACTSA